MNTGLRVTITAPGRAECKGRIEELRTPAELPDLPEIAATPARAILQEWNVSRVAMISFYAAPGRQCLFAALEIAGQWWDLQRQPLTIEPDWSPHP